MHHSSINLAVFHLQDVCVRVQKGLRKHLRTAGLEKAPRIDATFRWLHKRGIRIVLLSDYNYDETTLLLSRLGWAVGHEDLIHFAIVRQKQLPNPISRALELAAADAHRTITVTDTPQLLRAASNTGIHHNVGVTSGQCSFQNLRTSPHHALLDSPLQLVDYLLRLAPQTFAPAPPRPELGFGQPLS